MIHESDNHNEFLRRARQHISIVGGGAMSCPETRTSMFCDVEAARDWLNYDLRVTLQVADEELQHFERCFVNQHNQIVWTCDYNDMFRHLRLIFNDEKITSACFPQLTDVNELNDEDKCPLYHELGLPFFLSDEKIELGERGQAQFFHPDRLLTKFGYMLFCSMSNHAFSMLNNSKTNIFIVTIDQLLSNIYLAEVFSTFYNQSLQQRQGMQVIFHGNDNCRNILFVVNNQRTEVLKHIGLRSIFNCLQCYRCNAVCPVEQVAGKKSYNNIFTGPQACVLLPYMETEEGEKYTPEACVMCGRCEEVCPLHLSLRDMIVEARKDLLQRNITDRGQRQLIKRAGNMLQSRSNMNGCNLWKKIQFYSYVNPELKEEYSMPSFADKTFDKLQKK